MIWLQLLVQSVLDERGFKASQKETFNPSQLNHFKETENTTDYNGFKGVYSKDSPPTQRTKTNQTGFLQKTLLGLFTAVKVLSTSRLNFCTYKIEITNVILGFSYISSSQ